MLQEATVTNDHPADESAPAYTEEQVREQEALVQNLMDQAASEKRKLNRMLGLDENAGLGAKRVSLRSTFGPFVLETLKASPFPLNTTQLHLILGARAPEMKRMSGLISEMMEDKEVLRLAGGLYVHPENYKEGAHGPVMGKYAARGSKKKADGGAAAATLADGAAAVAPADADHEATSEEGEEKPEAPPPPVDQKPAKSKDKSKRR